MTWERPDCVKIKEDFPEEYEKLLSELRCEYEKIVNEGNFITIDVLIVVGDKPE